MPRVRGSYIFSRKLFLNVLLIWCLINSTVPFKCNSYMQNIAIVFSGWAFIILIFDMSVSPNKLFDFSGSKLFMLFTVVSVFSSIKIILTENLDGIVQNIYAVIAIVINIYIVYNNRFDRTEYLKFLKLGYIISLIIVMISHMTLIMHMNVEIPNSEGKIFTIGIERSENRFTGLLGNPNDLGRLALFGLLCLLLYWIMSEIRHEFWWGISAALFWLCIMLSESRGVIYSLFGALLIAGFVFVIVRYRRDNMSMVGKIGLLAIVFLVWLAFFFASHITTKVYYSFVNTLEKKIISEMDKSGRKDHAQVSAPVVMVEERAASGKGFSTGRSFLIKLGLSAATDYSIFTGLTPGNSKKICINYMKEIWDIEHPPSAAVGNTHNTLVQSFVNYGIIAFIFLLIAVIGIMFKLLKLTIFFNCVLPEWKENMIMLFALFSMSILAMVENVYLYSFENEPINLLFMLVLGYLFKKKRV